MAKLSDMVKTLRKSTGGTSADKAITKIDEWYDTGSMALNRVITGDVHKGLPSGRISTIYGVSGSGKSLIAAQTVAKALKDGKIDIAYWVDSEAGGTQILENFGAPMDKIEYVPVESIEKCSVALLTIYDSLVTAAEEYRKDPANNDKVRAIVVLDSFGALAADKLVSDAVKKDQMVQDMGLGSKLKNNMMRGLMMRVAKSGVALIIINHEYADPSAMFTSKIHKMSGGEGIQYASQVVLQASKLLIKDGDLEFSTGKEDADKKNGAFKGNRLRFFCTKNRDSRPCFEADVYIDFASGLSKYDGLIKDAVAYGFIQEVRGGYIVPSYSDKRVFYKDLVNNDEIWNTFIDEFNKKSAEDMKYHSGFDEELNRIQAELDGETTSKPEEISDEDIISDIPNV